jgi:glycosyltransferase involved in cell wall biosynthesis
MRQRILVFSDWYAPGYRAGGPIQSLVNLTSALSEFDFFIVTSDTDHHSETPYTEVQANRWSTYREHIQVCYLSADKITRTDFERLLNEVRPDTIYLNSLFSPRFTLLPLRMLRQKPNDCSVIVAPRGMLKSSALKEKATKKKVFLILAKILGWYKDIHWHATNAAEADEIRRHMGGNPAIWIADNLSSAPIETLALKQKKSGQLNLLCLARISPEKGIEEALKFLEGKDWNGQLAVDLIGAQQSPPFLNRCQEIANGLTGVNCRFLGEMHPSEVAKRWKDYHFLYLPTRGENFGHAIAESFNHGTPVIISDQTPWRNLEERGVGWDLPLQTKEFGDIVQHCVEMDQSAYDAMAHRAWSYAQEIGQKLDRLQSTRELFNANKPKAESQIMHGNNKFQ